MRVPILLLGAALVLAAPASAQTVVTVGIGLAQDCFLYAKLGKDAASGVDICNQAIARDVLTGKDKAATYDNRGIILDVMGRTDMAADDFNRAIALDPGLGDPHVNLGSILIKKHQYADALDQINKGLDLGVSYSHIGYFDRAVAEQMMGRFKEAYYDYKKVLEIEPGYAGATERLRDFTVIRSPG